MPENFYIIIEPVTNYSLIDQQELLNLKEGLSEEIHEENYENSEAATLDMVTSLSKIDALCLQ